ncbi:uncharacterized TPR repeat-containing protein At1g05150-like isoform X2 [Cynara cardunculus var. scolymus]|uniref:uncharacterized TPR repeat-containing protein At1g05150-like isoform X2 n=1 Tax=Cynara cardunculus var. scolymus TaxID=59895 RepID=UPI000D6284C8|nr:uncharacterized TPR repeat-containing protein At1g05150-like isoform X2 [Cynara cardunculus var. scolymus]
MATRGSRSEKVRRIFQQFDFNRDGGLNRDEMAALVVAVNPRVKFSDEQISAILDEVFRTYSEFIDGETGLTYDGLLRTYDDGAGDVDRDFEALGLELKPDDDNEVTSSLALEEASTSSVMERASSAGPPQNRRTAAWAASPNHGIIFDDTWKLVDDLEILIKRLKAKQTKDGKTKGENFDAYSDPGWSRELGPSSELDKRIVWEENSHDYALFVKELGSLRSRADGSRSREEAFDGHMALGRVLYDQQLFKESLVCFKRACELQPTDVRPHFRAGNCYYVIGRHSEAKSEFISALDAAEAGDAHCDLASALHAIGDDENAIKEFQKAIDLKPGHVDALYNLGGLYMDMGRYQRASEVYTRVLGVWPNHWRAQLNKAVSLLGAGETEEAKKALKEALKMTNRIELYDAIGHLKQLHKKKLKGNGSGKGNGDDSFIIVESLKFKTVGDKTTLRQELATALDIRTFQRTTRLIRCDVELLKKEMNENETPLTYSGNGFPEKSIRKASLEGVLRRLLGFLKPETFVGAVKAINLKILTVLDESESGRVDLGMFFAMIAPICGGTPEKRKRVAFDSLLWRPVNDHGVNGQIRKIDALRYIKLLRAIYIPSQGASELLEIHRDPDNSTISFTEFLALFDDPDWGFGIMSTLMKLETTDRNRHGKHSCAVCRYPIIGSRFKEMKSQFSLCGQCYSEGKVPPSFKQDEYQFKEYAKESEAVKDKCMWFSLHPAKSSSGTTTTTTTATTTTTTSGTNL